CILWIGKVDLRLRRCDSFIVVEMGEQLGHIVRVRVDFSVGKRSNVQSAQSLGTLFGDLWRCWNGPLADEVERAVETGLVARRREQFNAVSTAALMEGEVDGHGAGGKG